MQTHFTTVLDQERALADLEAGSYASSVQLERTWRAVTEMQNSAVRQAAIDLQRANIATLDVLSRLSPKPRGRSISQPGRRRGGMQHS